MTRQPRLSSQSGIYHVMLRGVNRQQIFEDDDDYRKFIMILHDMTSPKDELKRPLPPRCAFYTYCLMPNHVHLLIQEKEEKLSKTVKQIASRYAMYYNNKYEHFGHLFQDRFKSEPVNDYAYFFTLLRYIHQNPMAAGLTKDVASYQWSSWSEYEQTGNGIQTICSTKPVLSRMPLNDLRELVNDPLPKNTLILDFDSGSNMKTDDELRSFLFSSFGLKHPIDLQFYSRDSMNDILRKAKEYGGSIRQISRLTGISFTIVRNA